jgi:hypothetical protein
MYIQTRGRDEVMFYKQVDLFGNAANQLIESGSDR